MLLALLLGCFAIIGIIFIVVAIAFTLEKAERLPSRYRIRSFRDTVEEEKEPPSWVGTVERHHIDEKRHLYKELLEEKDSKTITYTVGEETYEIVWRKGMGIFEFQGANPDVPIEYIYEIYGSIKRGYF